MSQQQGPQESSDQSMDNRPYSQYTGDWQVPPWARPQENNAGTLQLFLLLIAAIIIALMLCIIVGVGISLHIAVLGFPLMPFIPLIVLDTLLGAR